MAVSVGNAQKIQPDSAHLQQLNKSSVPWCTSIVKKKEKKNNEKKDF